MSKNTFLRKALTKIKKIFIILFIAQLIYIVLLKWVDPPITITQTVSLIQGNGLKRDYVSFADISANARLAVIASEDQLFPDHNGFDVKSIEKVLTQDAKKSARIRGASTISQQVAKNVFLWQGKSYFRKGLEAYMTFMIENMWGKKRVLDVYLNCIEMGKGIFGIEAAAQAYFNKPASQLSRQEAAMIAACFPNPKIYTVKPVSGFVSYKSRWILNQMNNVEDDEDIQDIIKN